MARYEYLESIRLLRLKPTASPAEALDGLYALTTKLLLQKQGSALLAQFEGSVSKMVGNTFPAHSWSPWKFSRPPHHFWESLAATYRSGDPISEVLVREFVENLGRKFGVDGSLDRWVEVVGQVNSPEIFSHFGSITDVLTQLFPEKHWEFDRAGAGPIHRPVLLSRFEEEKMTEKDFKDRTNARRYLDALKAQLGGSFEDLYQIQKHHFWQTGGGALLRLHRKSPSAVIMAVYESDYEWKPWKFSRTPLEFFDRLAADFRQGRPKALKLVRLYLKDVEKTVGIKKSAEWKEFLSKRALPSTIGGQMAHFGSILALLKTFYPNEPALNELRKEGKVSKVFRPEATVDWTDKATLESYMAFLLEESGGKQVDDFYLVQKSHFVATGGKQLLGLHGRSPGATLMECIPDHHWQPWRFGSTPKGWWASLALAFDRHDERAHSSLREYLETFVQPQMNISQTEEWQEVPDKALPSEILKKLRLFGGLQRVLRRLYPNIDWEAGGSPGPAKELKRYSQAMLPASYWRSSATRDYLDHLKNQLGGTYEGLYSLGFGQIVRTGGETLASLYNNSVSLVIMFAYPEHAWAPWNFKKSPNNFWRDLSHHIFHADSDSSSKTAYVEILRVYVDDLEGKLGVKEKDDWYKVSRDELAAHTTYRIDLLGGLPAILKKVYPLHPWQKSRFQASEWKKRIFQQKLQGQVDHLI